VELCPSWSPDGTTIAFALGRRRSGYDIALIAPDGGARRRLTPDPLTQFHPDWAPDGSAIAYTAYDEFDLPSIEMIRPDGTGRTVVHEGGIHGASEPVFSPRGTRIAFCRDTRRGIPHIWIVGSDGSNPIRATSGPAYETAPGWQPIEP
jgi:Tol biopolymer transport system component